MIKKELKSRLLETGIFIDNEWFTKYIDLIIENKETEPIKYKTQNHHIIPKCYYKDRNIPVDNTEDNLVNLLLQNHLLAHCYMVLCSRDKKFRTSMFYAICFISGLKVEEDTKVIELIQSDLSVYQEAYEQSRKDAYDSNPMFDDVKKAHHDERMRSFEVRLKISNTLKLRHASKNQTSLTLNKNFEKHKHSLSESAKLRCFAYKDGVRKRILKQDAPQFVLEGWNVPYILGRGYKENMENLIWVYKGNIRKQITESLLSEYLNKGFVKGSGVHQDSEFRKSLFTDEVRKKMSESHKGQSPANKGVPCSEEKKAKLSKRFTGTRWMNNGVIQKQVQSIDIEQYLSEGFVFGRLRR